jgi:hypothetical protein
MFNLKENLSHPLRSMLAEGETILREQREALTADMEARGKVLAADMEARGKVLSEAALARFSKIMLISAGMITLGLLAVAAALIFGH